MKIFILLTALFALSAADIYEPRCLQGDLDTLWPNYDDITKYYECYLIGIYGTLQCHGGTVFSFTHQRCMPPGQTVGAPALEYLPTQKPGVEPPKPEGPKTTTLGYPTPSHAPVKPTKVPPPPYEGETEDNNGVPMPGLPPPTPKPEGSDSPPYPAPTVPQPGSFRKFFNMFA